MHTGNNVSYVGQSKPWDWVAQKPSPGSARMTDPEQIHRDEQMVGRYVADPMARADDSAMLQYIENSLKIFKLDEELLANQSAERSAEIKAQRAAFAATQYETFRFLQRIAQQ